MLDLEDPVVLLLLLDQLEPRVRRERLNAVRQDVPVLPPDPRELFPGKKEQEQKIKVGMGIFFLSRRNERRGMEKRGNFMLSWPRI